VSFEDAVDSGKSHDADHTDRIIAQGRILVWAIEALGEIQSSLSRCVPSGIPAGCARVGV
jgi:hypothetical protein